MYSFAARPRVATTIALLLVITRFPTDVDAQDLQENAAFHAHEAGPVETGSIRTGTGVILFTDDFEGGLGAWNTSDVSAVGAQWSDWDCWSGSGVRSAACAAGGVAAISCGEEYPGDMKTWMVHGPLDLTGADLVWADLEFLLHLSSEPDFDRFFVGVSTDGVDFFGSFSSGASDGTVVFPLTDLLGNSQVFVGFQFTSDPSSSRLVGAAIDDVVIRTSPPPGPGRQGWTISSSSLYPGVNVGEPVASTAPDSLFLWYSCNAGGVAGVTACEFDLQLEGGLLAGFTPRNGFLNAGSATSLVLATGCVDAPVVAGVWVVLDPLGEGIVACPVATSTGIHASRDCHAPSVAWPNGFVGYDGTGLSAVPCESDSICEGTISVDPSSWGQLKALYR